MRLVEASISNFRGYQSLARLSVRDLTAIVGQNDAGKSSILEALNYFFNEEQFPFDGDDLCRDSVDKVIKISCAFEQFPAEIVLDDTSRTNLFDEELINSFGFLELVKEWDCTSSKPKSRKYIRSVQRDPSLSNLLSSKITELKARAKQLGVEDNVEDLRVSASIRKAIRNSFDENYGHEVLVPLDKEDGKAVWERIRVHLPTYHLFKADRTSTDADGEVQDPLKASVVQAVKELEDKLNDIKEEVRARALEVAKRTVEKISEINPELGDDLHPIFDEPKWANVFKVSLEDSRGISINKKGSGTRRLILLGFLRAEAEKRSAERIEESGNSVPTIYAIEEPETAQHPANQRKVINALLELSRSQNAQVLLTTHVPGLAGLLPAESVRFVRKTDHGPELLEGEGILAEAADSLGVVPDAREPALSERPKVLVCVEGPHDISFLNHVSKTLSQRIPNIPDLSSSSLVRIIPLGGETLRNWVVGQYLRGLGLKEVHIYDRDNPDEPKYAEAIAEVNARGDGSIAVATMKKEMENYIHPNAIQRTLNIGVKVEDFSDIPDLVAKEMHAKSKPQLPWDQLKGGRRRWQQEAKKKLNDNCASAMSFEEISEIDSGGEITFWLRTIYERAQ